MSRVLLLHGVMSSAATWWRVGPELERHGIVPLALDLPWHGGAPRPPGTPDLEAFTDGVAARLDGPVDAVVGHSLGALVALDLVRRHGTGATRLVLEDPPEIEEAERPLFAAGLRGDSAAVAADRDAVRRRERDANPRWHDLDIEHSVAGIEQADAERLADAMTGALDWDLVRRVRESPASVHVLAGARATASLEDGGSALRDPARTALRELLGAGAFVELDGGHCLHRDDPAGWVAAVARALAA
jgi:pimeloyl-ACP methyl ester carboxylesterase